MLAALVAGERDPKVLAQLARARMRAKLSLLEEAFTGLVTDQHALLLAKMLARVDALDADLAELDAKLQELIAPFTAAVQRLDEIPGVGQTAAHLLIAEIGTDTGPVPNRRAPGLLGQVRPRRQRVRRQPKGSGSTGHRNPTSLACSGRSPSPPARPIPSWVNATGGSPVDAARNERSSRSVGPFWSSSGICCPTHRPGSTTSAPASTTPVSVPNAPSATTSASWKPSATRSPRPRRLTGRHRATSATLRSGPSPDTAACPPTANFRIRMRSQWIDRVCSQLVVVYVSAAGIRRRSR